MNDYIDDTVESLVIAFEGTVLNTIYVQGDHLNIKFDDSWLYNNILTTSNN